jgi:flagellar hook-basal body complex protein FliE
MKIDGINNQMTAGLLQLSQGVSGGTSVDSKVPGQSFGNFFVDAVQNTNNLQQIAENKIQGVLTGEVEDLHQVMIAMEKASLSFQMTMQVRNKIIDAYQEIMRMQI